MVFMRWAMVRTVQLENSWRMVAWIRQSVSRSTAAVASSRMRMRDLRSRALARHRSCLWPTLRFPPPSVTSWFSPSFNPPTYVFK
uniref:Uncharacterized protein n=1 Tax=Anguilla anguilla TaxID=7936 RepID=A0A0E9WUT8_ANGAN